jgi:hypothetical protein
VQRFGPGRHRRRLNIRVGVRPGCRVRVGWASSAAPETSKFTKSRMKSKVGPAAPATHATALTLRFRPYCAAATANARYLNRPGAGAGCHDGRPFFRLVVTDLCDILWRLLVFTLDRETPAAENWRDMRRRYGTDKHYRHSLSATRLTGRARLPIGTAQGDRQHAFGLTQQRQRRPGRWAGDRGHDGLRCCIPPSIPLSSLSLDNVGKRGMSDRAKEEQRVTKRNERGIATSRICAAFQGQTREDTRQPPKRNLLNQQGRASLRLFTVQAAPGRKGNC